MAPVSDRRSGFTLIELLAVLCVIAVIVSLMLPALGWAREAARRSQCLNNLKQISLALHNYENANKVLPPGAVDVGGPVHSRPDARAMAWIVQLLPYMEQNAVYQSIDMNASPHDLANSTAAFVRISSLSCPTDDHRPWAPGSYGVNSYAGCHHDVEAPIDVDNHGVFFLNSHVRSADITDGTSFTIYVGEKVSRPGELDFWMSGTRATLRNTSTINATSRLGDDTFVGGFGSRHPAGGADFAFGDGSVHFLSERINPAVFRHLGNRDDGEPISAGSWSSD